VLAPPADRAAVVSRGQVRHRIRGGSSRHAATTFIVAAGPSRLLVLEILGYSILVLKYHRRAPDTRLTPSTATHLSRPLPEGAVSEHRQL